MGGFIGSLAQQMAGGAAGGAMGLLLGGFQNRQQYKQQERLQGLQMKGNKEMMDYQMMKELQMWKDTNYQAQMEELKKAGLNPGLLYGMSGGGGSTTGSATAGVTGGTAQAGQAVAMAQSGAQMGLMRAQKENIEADTAQKKAETTKTAGVDTTKTETEIASLTQGIQNQKASQRLTDGLSTLAQIETQYQQLSLNDRLDIVNSTGAKMIEEIDILHQQKLLDTQTRETKVTLIKAEAIGATLRNTLTQAQTEQTKQLTEESKVKIRQISETIMQEWKKIGQQDQRNQLEAVKEIINAQYPRQATGGQYPQWRFEHDVKSASEGIIKIMQMK